MTALDWNRKSVLKSWAISRTSLWKGNLRISSSVDFWYLDEHVKLDQVTVISLPPDLPEGNCTRPVTVGLLNPPSSRCRLAGGLGCQLLPEKEYQNFAKREKTLPWSLSSSGLPCSLLGASHGE